jgi:hypothetical protein
MESVFANAVELRQALLQKRSSALPHISWNEYRLMLHF